jgi:hypothetical protein
MAEPSFEELRAKIQSELEEEYAQLPEAVQETARSLRHGKRWELTPELEEHICMSLAQGMSLAAICRQKGMPRKTVVTQWIVNNHNGFAEKYAIARAAQALHWGEEILEIADNPTLEWQHKRIMVDTRKWLLGKILPKVYGDRISLDATVRTEERSLDTGLFRFVLARMAATGESMASAQHYAERNAREVAEWLGVPAGVETLEAEIVEDTDEA